MTFGDKLIYLRKNNRPPFKSQTEIVTSVYYFLLLKLINKYTKWKNEIKINYYSANNGKDHDWLMKTRKKDVQADTAANKNNINRKNKIFEMVMGRRYSKKIRYEVDKHIIECQLRDKKNREENHNKDGEIIL